MLDNSGFVSVLSFHAGPRVGGQDDSLTTPAARNRATGTSSRRRNLAFRTLSFAVRRNILPDPSLESSKDALPRRLLRC